jgi:hypothetical protein
LDWIAGTSPAMTKLTADSVQQIVSEEIATIAHDAAKLWIKSRLITPERIDLFCEYRNDERFDAWIIGDVGERNVIIQYCHDGFCGTSDSKWGLNFRGEKHFGMDAGWFLKLESIAFEWLGSPEGYEVP